ncbi:Arylsulfatase [Rubripirellula lacrimiformis]|uniref:Arylsulfatase n=1 Tax=Rubripirellula lacrimiformis TaxID=1930273 RepID=A0A517NJP2_9BACT|nr:sulfatase [Rubripirellula lacrimiformis]QDT07357.1 Arylsulfatase [Rubripirellula lacrimiformis]
MQKSNLSLTILIGLLCMTSGGRLPGQESTDADPQQADKIRNVLLIVSDDLRASTLGCYGDQITRTPNLDRLAANGMVFDRVYCQGTWCAPSRRSFMRSRYVDVNCPTLGETLIDAGIPSVRVGKIFHMRVPGDIVDGTDGEDIAQCWTQRFNSQGDEAHTVGDYACLNQNIFTTAMEGRQGARTAHRAFVTVQVDGDASDQPDSKSASKATQLLNQYKDQPFFLAVGLIRPHYPMVAPQAMFGHYPPEAMELPSTWNQDIGDSGIPPAGLASGRSAQNGIGRFPINQKRMWSGYRASVEFMDAQVGRILDSLDELGLSESTAVIFTSDHGYHLGDHTFWQKSNLHEHVARVPLIIRPGTPPSTSQAQASRSPEAAGGRRSESLVELVDLYPTICDWLSVDTPDDCQGTSLLPILADPSSKIREAAITVGGKNKTRNFLYRTKRWALMSYHDGTSELYDMPQDPEQRNNLSGDPHHAATKNSLQQRLDAVIAERGLSLPSR